MPLYESLESKDYTKEMKIDSVELNLFMTEMCKQAMPPCTGLSRTLLLKWILNELNDPKGQENMICTMIMYGETFNGRPTAHEITIFSPLFQRFRIKLFLNASYPPIYSCNCLLQI